MRKRLWSTMIVLCMILSLLPHMAFAADKDFEQYQSGTVTVNVGKLNVRDLPIMSGSEVLGTVSKGEKVKVLAAYLGGRNTYPSFHAIEYNGSIAYISAYGEKLDKYLTDPVVDTDSISPAGTEFAFGDCGFAAVNSYTLTIYDKPLDANISVNRDDMKELGTLLMGDKVYVLGAYLFGADTKPNFHAVAYKGKIGYIKDNTGKLLTDCVVLGKQPLMGQSGFLPSTPPVKEREITLPGVIFRPKANEAPQLMYGSNPAAVGSSHYDCTVEALSYDQAVCQPYSWVTAMVTYRANDGWVFKEKYESEMKSVGIIYDRKSEDTLVVTYTAWVGADGLEVRPTQAMKDYAKLHAGDTANGGAPVATGKRNDLIVDRWEGVTDPATINLYAAQVWKYPTMASGSEKIGRVWEKMRIYDLHAERLFPEAVGQWYLVECSNKIGFVPAAYVKDINESDFWDGAPAVRKESPYVFAGGSGTKEDPYLIETADQLNAIRYGLDRHYKLIADIDLSTWGNWQPIGGTPAYGGLHNATNQKADKGQGAFIGTLNGGGHVISGMTIIDHREKPWAFENYANRAYGLFSKVYGPWSDQCAVNYDKDERRVIWDLGLVNYNIDLSYTNLTGPAFFNVAPFFATGSQMCLDNCYAAGGSIKFNYGGTPPQINIGGLVGDIGLATVRGCYHTSDITVTAAAGHTMTNSDYNLAGGIAASICSVWIHDCFNTGSITLPFGPWTNCSRASGIVGEVTPPQFPLLYYYEENGMASVVKDCYNAGALTGNGTFGILDGGATDVYVYRNYNVGELTTGGDAVSGDIISPFSLVITEGNAAHFVHDNGQASCTGDAWQDSSLGRKVLKVHPEDTLTIPTPQFVVPTVGGFSDVRTDAWYADAVSWAVEKGITAGTSATTFSPADTCTRAQILTFLWRAVGSPKTGAKNPFADVKPDDYYYDAAIWASEKAMVTGSTFDGNTPCTRASTVIYLWQNAGAPDTAVCGTFTDVPANAAYAKAVTWAVQNGVTSGTSETTFSPETICDRGQIVTFLNRALK